MARLNLTLLGGFQLQLFPAGALSLPTKKAQALVAYLGLRPGQAHPRDKLAALLWGNTAEEQARHSLRQTLFALRKALPATKAPMLLIEGETLAFNPSMVEVDVAAFERLVAEGTPEALERAATLYQGDLLIGLDVKEPLFEEWLLGERERLRELALEGLAKLLAHQSRAGTTERAIQTAIRLLALDALQEPVHRMLMRLYARQGRRAAALRQYQACVGLLRRELGVEPEPETRLLYQEILQRRPPDSLPTEVEPRRLSRRPAGKLIRPRPATSTPETPLIGRQLELERLLQALNSARHGQGQIVMVAGEAGIGKSRLVEELSIEGLRRDSRILVGRSYETEHILPFRAWVDALRAGQVVSEAEPLKALGPVWRAELSRLFPELGEPGLPPISDTQDYLRLFEAVAHLIGRLAAHEPLLLILEDLHWADEMTLSLLSFLSHRLSGCAVLVVGTVREEELVGTSVLRHLLEELNRQQHFLYLALSRLSRQDTISLVQALARADAEERETLQLAEEVWDFSQGNPFMAVEAMQSLQDAKMLDIGRGFPLPQRVREVIAGRLERLGNTSRRLAAVAAIIGREFDFDLLQRAAAIGELEAAEALEELVRRRVLHGVGEHFDFTHERIREVVYGQLLPPHRRLLHGMVAKALEEMYAADLEPHYQALAAHCREADRPQKGVEYALHAGDVAAKRYAYAEATGHYQEALTIAKTLPTPAEASRYQIDAILRLAAVGTTRQDIERDRAHLDRARALAEELGDEKRLVQVLDWVRRIDRRQRGHEAWAVRLLGEIASHLEPFEAHRVAGHFRQALALAEELGMRRLAAHCHLGLANLYRRTGNRPAAQEHRAIATAISQEIGMGSSAEQGQGDATEAS